MILRCVFCIIASSLMALMVITLSGCRKTIEKNTEVEVKLQVFDKETCVLWPTYAQYPIAGGGYINDLDKKVYVVIRLIPTFDQAEYVEMYNKNIKVYGYYVNNKNSWITSLFVEKLKTTSCSNQDKVYKRND